ncbi:hypothetical protein, partial [Burkholderia sp. SIMBA_024]|uniref:hypothetical protein n=1 Tax=Burkholderia sp. SIMBA_024 TaxID=3085768 RepID=UPI0039784136
PVEGKAQEYAKLRAQRQQLAGEMGAIQSQAQQYLQETMPEFEAAEQVNQEAVATQQAAAEQEQVVREIERELSEDASTQKIMDTVITKLGTPDNMDEAQEMADIV